MGHPVLILSQKSDSFSLWNGYPNLKLTVVTGGTI
jgi:hypothetical protein